LSASSLNFGSQNMGSSSAPQTATLTNSGNAWLAITSITLAGANSSDFGQTNNCFGAVAPGATCQINVTFSPTGTGTRMGSLTITDDAAGSPHSISLSGMGVPPATPPGTYTLTVTATLTSASGTLAHTIPLTLTVS
jgi:surface-anchored protein